MRPICIMGPTASGKSNLALHIARRIPAEIISVDSALVYREMDIGTAKPTLLERDEVRHHLIDIINPDAVFSVANFITLTRDLVKEISERKRLPILVGGTMMYFHALQHGLTQLPNSKPELRIKLLKQIENKGLASLYNDLLKIDAKSANKINPHDSQRIIRALEVFLQTGRPLSAWHNDYIAQLNNQFINVCIMPEDRSKLHETINQRLLLMLQSGFIEEVENIWKKWQLTEEHASMRTVGYRQVLAYLLDTISYDQMVAKAQAATRQLAKRQLTWCRSWHKIDFTIDTICEDYSGFAEQIVSNFFC
jgi:tRNA dimethylallyltransferase